jgi:hypothetical protein
LAESPIKSPTVRPWKYQAGSYTHPLDQLFRKIQLPELKEAIAQKKTELCKQKIEGDRRKAIDICSQEMSLRYTKDEIILNFCKNLDIKKSWTKAKIIAAIVTQDFAEKFLEIPPDTHDA